MAGAAPAKKSQKEVEARHGIWLSPAGMLSFGLGMEDELLIEEGTYNDIKGMSVADRISQYELIKNPPPVPEVAEVAAESPAPAEAAPAAPEAVTEGIPLVSAAAHAAIIKDADAQALADIEEAAKAPEVAPAAETPQ